MVTKDTIFDGKFGQHTCLNQGMVLAFYTVSQLICSSGTITSYNIVNNRPAVTYKFVYQKAYKNPQRKIWIWASNENSKQGNAINSFHKETETEKRYITS